MEIARFDELLKDAEDWDPDKKFMAANDLCEAVVKDQINDPEKLKKVVRVFQTQLNDEKSDVQGNAIRCLSRVMNKLSQELVQDVSKTMIQKVVEEKGDFRDVYATCIKTLINDVPHNYAMSMQPVLTEAINGIKEKRKSKNWEVEEELIDIISNLFKKWAPIFASAKFSKEDLLQLLKTNITEGDKNSIRKKSCSCLGAFAQVLNNQEITKLVAEFIQQAGQLQDWKKNKDRLIFTFLGINAISKTVANKLTHVAPQVADFIIANYIVQLKTLEHNQDDSDFKNFVSELFEHYLSTLENLIKGCPKEIEKYLEKIIDLAAELLEFDPDQSAVMVGQSSEMEEEDDEYGYLSDDGNPDDSSWRVRRSAIYLIETVIKSRNDCIKKILKDCLGNQQKGLISRLAEKNENIRLANFQAHLTLIKSIVIQDNVSQTDKMEEEEYELLSNSQFYTPRSSLQSYDVTNIVSEILSQVELILKDKKASTAIKSGALRLIESLSKHFNKTIISDPLIWNKVFKLVRQILQEKGAPNELKVTGFISLKRLFKIPSGMTLDHLAKDIPNVLQLCIENVKQDYFKIVSETFRCINSIFYLMHRSLQSQMQNFSQQIKHIIPLILSKLKESDIDQEIKQSVIACASSVLNNLGEILSQTEIAEIFQHLLEKVKQETKKITILKLFKSVPQTLSSLLNEQCIVSVNGIITELCTFLQKQDRSLKISTLEAIDNLVRMLGDKNFIKPDILNSLLKDILQFVNSVDIFLAQIALGIVYKLLLSNCKPSQDLLNILDACVKFAQTSIIQGQSFNILYDVFSLFAKNKIITLEQTVEKLLSTLNKDALNCLAKSSSALILMADQGVKNKFVNLFLQDSLNKGADPLKRQVSLLTLCEIGKHFNLCQDQQILDGVLKLIQDKQEKVDEIRQYASIAFGGICLGNLDKSLPIVIKFIKESKDGQYLMLNTLKEIIQNTNQFTKSMNEIVNFLFECSQSPDESNRNIVAECIGKIALINLKEMKQHLIKNIGSANNYTRYTTATSFKYFCVKGIHVDNDLKELIRYLIINMKDSDINTRTAILRSLNSASFNIPFSLIDYIKKEDFFDPLLQSLEFKKDLIKEVELGSFKHKIDDGQYLRNAAFSLLDIAVDHLYYKGIENFESEVVKAVLQSIEEDHSDDIKIIRFQILIKLSQKNPLKIVPFLENIAEKFDKILRPYASKQEGERAQDTLKTCLRCVYGVNQIAEQENNSKFIQFYNLVKQTKNFDPILESFSQIN